MNKIMTIVNLIIGLVCIGLFMFPSVFASGGYGLSVDGVVVARAIALLYGLFSMEKAIKHAVKISEESEVEK